MADENKAAATEAAEAQTIEMGEFEGLLRKEFKPKTDRAREAVQTAVQELAAQALQETALISDDAVRTIETIIAEIDRKLSEQINLIIHHPDFQQLEGTWRGLSYLVNNTETDEMLKIRVINLNKKDLAKTLKKSIFLLLQI